MQCGNELYHYGRLGMKWGRRKSSGATSSNTPKKERSEDYKAVRKLKKKSIYEMSNKEIETITKRLQLEKQYKDLKKEQIKKGKNIVTGVIKVGKTANEAYKLYNSPLVEAIRTKMIKPV